MLRRPKLIVLSLALGALTCYAATGTVAAEPTFPYTAYANADNVHVRSGPGENYYPTATLPKGAAVEVYRHDPGGWYAVRPPDGSFSWVQADGVRPLDDRIVMVEGARAVARVGSQLSDIRDVIQVRLEPGEQLQVLGAKTFGGQTWYKIAPPSGEFRWVYGRFLQQQPAAVANRPAADSSTGQQEAVQPMAVQQADGDANNGPSDVELAGLWPKRNAQGQGLWKKRAAAAEPPAEEFAAPQPDRWWQRGEARQRAAEQWDNQYRERPYADEPYSDERYSDERYVNEPFVDGPYNEEPYNEEPYIVYEDGPPEEYERRGRRYDGPSVYERGDDWNTARARLSPHLRELADAEARDGDAEEPYPGSDSLRQSPRRGYRVYDREDDRYDRTDQRGYSSRDRERARDDRRRRDDYALDDRRERYDEIRSADERDSFKVRLPSRGGYGNDAGELSSDFDWLDMELSTLVVEEAPPADYDDLRERAEDLLAKASTPLERGQARLMMEKIDRFAELTDRNVSLARRQRDRAPASRTARRSAPELEDGAMTGDNALRAKVGRYDGVGKLTAVVSERPGSPAYALLDDRGKVQCYVTPAPGVNLRHYVGQEVGLNGSVGFNAELSRRQVVAQRITPLDDGPIRR